MSVQAFFLPAEEGERFCLFHPAQGPERGAVVYVHPFAEEMNKSRRMAALQARALARAGHAVLQIDLLGCGDSSGDFGDASWDAWVDDVQLARRWLQARSRAPLWLWGLRAGALLAADAAARGPGVTGLLLWQPTPTGRAVLQQFLRLKVAAGALGGPERATTERLRAQLAAGTGVEIAGYRLGPALAAGLDRATLDAHARIERLAWIELSARGDAPPSPAAESTLAGWRDTGVEVGRRVVEGPPFWQTAEIEEAPRLIDATLDALAAVQPA